MNEHKAVAQKGGFGKRIRGYFFTGLLVLIPVVLTGWIIWKLFLAIDGILRPYVHPFLTERFGIDFLKSRLRFTARVGLLGLFDLPPTRALWQNPLHETPHTQTQISPWNS